MPNPWISLILAPSGLDCRSKTLCCARAGLINNITANRTCASSPTHLAFMSPSWSPSAMPIRISVLEVPFPDAVAVAGPTWVRCVVALILLVAVGQVVRAVRSWKRLRHVPGPALACWSSLWMVRRLSSGRFHESMCEMMEDYGTSGFSFSCTVHPPFFFFFCLSSHSISFFFSPPLRSRTFGVDQLRRPPCPHRPQ